MKQDIRVRETSMGVDPEGGLEEGRRKAKHSSTHKHMAGGRKPKDGVYTGNRVF